jgi:hypothetical protein
MLEALYGFAEMLFADPSGGLLPFSEAFDLFSRNSVQASASI